MCKLSVFAFTGKSTGGLPTARKGGKLGVKKTPR